MPGGQNLAAPTFKVPLISHPFHYRVKRALRPKFTGLPHDVKKPLAFTITYQDQSKTVTHDPATNCHAAFDVALDGTAAK